MKYLLLALLWMAAGCAQLGMPIPQTFNERIATAYASVSAIRDTATVLLQAKKISPDDAQNVQTQADNARAGIEIARKILDLESANAKLSSVQAGLVALQAYLATKK